MRKLFQKEVHFSCAASIFVCGYVFFMHFIFRSAWANSSFSVQLSAAMEEVIPAIRRLSGDSVNSTSYWRTFFSFFWITSPIYWVLGFFGAPLLSPTRYKKWVTDTTTFRVVTCVLLFSFGVGFYFAFPVFDGMFFIHQTSRAFPVLTFSWWIVSGIIYYQAQACRVLIMKFQR